MTARSSVVHIFGGVTRRAKLISLSEFARFYGATVQRVRQIERTQSVSEHVAQRYITALRRAGQA